MDGGTFGLGQEIREGDRSCSRPDTTHAVCGITRAVTVTAKTTTSDMTLETKDDLKKITIALNQAALDPTMHIPPPAAFGAGGPM